MFLASENRKMHRISLVCKTLTTLGEVQHVGFFLISNTSPGFPEMRKLGQRVGVWFRVVRGLPPLGLVGGGVVGPLTHTLVSLMYIEDILNSRDIEEILKSTLSWT